MKPDTYSFAHLSPDTPRAQGYAGRSLMYCAAAASVSEKSDTGQMMNGIIRQESDAQPYTYQEMMASIDDAVNSPRWAGLRHPDKLEAQRERWAAENAVPDMPAINHPAQPDTQQIVDALSKAIRESLTAGQESIPIEITFINPDTGARQTVNTKPKGRVTTAMNYP
ncbi:hypothetical protein ACISK3_10065 [Morganella morganii]|nr:hypothetical protein [Morganella morganii]